MHKPLSVTLPNDREVRVLRSLNAPRKHVWDAFTKPELIRRWMLGPPGWTMPVCEMDVRVGGAYRWRWRSREDGKEFGFVGNFLEVEPPAKLVHEEHFDPGDVGGPMSIEPAIVTTTFDEAGGVTTISVSIVFASKDSRDGAISTGMTDGMEMSYAGLERILTGPS